MARILAISSLVASGHVGLSAAWPVLTALGHETIALPTRVLSNHPGHPHSAAHDIPVAALAAMLDALAANGRLAGTDLILTGYLPSRAYCDLALTAIARVRRQSPAVRVLVDPILGDDPGGLYVATEAAAAIRDCLLPHADIVTPNRFELSWLSGCEVTDIATAAAAAARLARPMLLATSIPATAGHLANVLCLPGGCCAASSVRRTGAPHGTGDLLAALFVGHLLSGRSAEQALARASAGVEIVIADSLGAEELRLADRLAAAIAADAAPIVEHR